MNDDPKTRAQRVAESARSLHASLPPPRAEGKSTAEEFDTVVRHIEDRQTQVVAVIGEALGAVAEVVAELHASVDEDQLVRKEVVSLTNEVRKLRHLVRCTSWATMLSVAAGALCVVWATHHQLNVSSVQARNVLDIAMRLNTVDDNTSIATEMLLKQAEVSAKGAEVAATKDPSAIPALKAAIELQEVAAQGRIDVAATRRGAPPLDASRLLREARQKKAALGDAATVQIDQSVGPVSSTPAPDSSAIRDSYE